MREIVKFENGKFGVRTQKKSFFKDEKFLDLRDNKYTWSVGQGFDDEIQGELEDCKKYLLNVEEE